MITLSDGNLTFPFAAALNGSLALTGGKSALVVGVGYAADDYLTPLFARNRDLTPPTPLSAIKLAPGMPPPRAEDYGGAEDFYRFLVEELRPAVAAAYPVDPDDQTLYGHSLGGLFTLGVLFRHPKSFRNFVASSPSIWWNRRALIRGEAAFATRIARQERGPRVLITVGATEQELPYSPVPHMTAAQAGKLIRQARMVDNARELADRLSGIQSGAGFLVRFTAFEDEDHLTVVPASISRALMFALRPDV
jgi:predicted alpha/beta superfamily hydrolase